MQVLYIGRKKSLNYCDNFTPPEWILAYILQRFQLIFSENSLFGVFLNVLLQIKMKLIGFSLFLLAVSEQTILQTCRRFHFKASAHVQITAGSHYSSFSSSCLYFIPLCWNRWSKSLSFGCWTKSKVIFCRQWFLGVGGQICQSQCMHVQSIFCFIPIDAQETQSDASVRRDSWPTEI